MVNNVVAGLLFKRSTDAIEISNMQFGEVSTTGPL
jgi:hypothetical protein